MPTTVTKYKCNVCGGVFDDSTGDISATTCENGHPGTMSFARAAQVYEEYKVMPDNISITHNGKTYTYYLKEL